MIITMFILKPEDNWKVSAMLRARMSSENVRYSPYLIIAFMIAHRKWKLSYSYKEAEQEAELDVLCLRKKSWDWFHLEWRAK